MELIVLRLVVEAPRIMLGGASKLKPNEFFEDGTELNEKNWPNLVVRRENSEFMRFEPALDASSMLSFNSVVGFLSLCTLVTETFENKIFF
jgi:hypothetical protein